MKETVSKNKPIRSTSNTITLHSSRPEFIKSVAYRLLDAAAVYKAHYEGIDSRRIVCVCRRGQCFADNPKYILDALEKLYPGIYDIVLLAFQKPRTLPSYIRFVYADTRDAIRELAKARLWIADTRTNWPIDKTKKQMYLQTWHASMGPKLSEKRAEGKLSKGYIDIAKRDGAFTNFMFANDNIHEESFTYDYWQTGPVLRCGIPRNRPLIHFDKEKACLLRKKLGISERNGVLLYAPTFRNAVAFEQQILDLERCKKVLETRFSCSFTIAFRLHPEVAKEARPDYLTGYIDFTDYPDTQELLCATDVLISDYSSILEDFLLLGRPCFTFAPDIEEYEKERGFYYSLEKRPAPFSITEEDLLSNIANYNHADFLEKRTTFFKWLGLTEDGKGDELIARVIHECMPESISIAEALERCHNKHLFDSISRIQGMAPKAKPPIGALSL